MEVEKVLLLAICLYVPVGSFLQRGDISINQITNSKNNTFAPDAYFSKTNESSKESKDEQRSQSRFGSVSSPFFFMCHSPRPGEPTDVGASDVKLSISTNGKQDLESGYQPGIIYELLVSSSVLLDGFLLTGVHALTNDFMASSHLHLPPSASSKNSAGTVCAFLHSHLSKLPRSRISLLWRAPPAGTGCVVFLATGSLQDRLFFKDLVVKEVCEKASTIGQLRVQESVLVGQNGSEFVFKDDFENHKLHDMIWEEVKSGRVEDAPFRKNAGMSLMLEGPHSLVQTRPMDFSKAKHVQFSFGPGICGDKGRVRVSFGSVDSLPKALPTPQQPITSTHVPIVEKVDTVDIAAEGSGSVLYPAEAINSESITESSGEADTELIAPGGDEGFQENPVEKLKSAFLSSLSYKRSGEPENVVEGSGMRVMGFYDIMQADERVSKSCSYWEEVDVHDIPVFQEVHTKAIPSLFRRRNVCIKWEADPDEKDFKQGLCWSLDNVAVVTKDAKAGPIIDDFDPVDPSNWLFFPGAEIKEMCGSEGNSLAFDGSSADSWVSTRQIDLSEVDLQSDGVLHKLFREGEDGWDTTGGEIGVCGGEPSASMTFQNEGKRVACSPFLDGRRFAVLRVVGGVSSCYRTEEVTVFVILEEGQNRSKINDILFRAQNEVVVLPLTSAFQKDRVKICLEQKDETQSKNAWHLEEISFLPWMPPNPKYFLQVQMNLKCGYSEGQVDIEASSDGGSNWWSLHQRCVPGRCQGDSSALSPMIATGLDSGWTLLTLPLPYIALTPNTRIRIKQLEPGNSIWHPSWAIDYVYIGKCPSGCSGRGLCTENEKCKCEYGYVGNACETPERKNPVYISEPFVGNIDTSANILEVSGVETSYQCGVIGSGQAAIFKGRNLRYLTTVDLDTTSAHLLQFHFRAGTISTVGKCPGPDKDSESVYVHYSCDGGVTWHLLHTLHPEHYREPSHVSLLLPPSARNLSCRFQIWQAEHSGSGRDMWAIDDLTVTSQRFNTIELDFENSQDANNSLRFHLGNIGSSCGRNTTMVFQDSSNNGLFRFLETKSIGLGPSFMMQFDLAIGCDVSNSASDLDSTVVLEYSLNHGLTWQLVQGPCTPSTLGCDSYFTRGTTYHTSEYKDWKRTTLRLPKHTWSPTTRLRLRQVEVSDVGLPWSVDNVFIGHQCDGLCSGHGYCTTRGCRCDDAFHGHKCLPLHKLDREIDADFDKADHITKYSFQVIGGNLAAQFEGCGTVVSGNNLYFGKTGIRHFETDDINAENIYSIMFYLVIGGDHGLQRACQSSKEVKATTGEEVSYGSVVLEYSVDGGMSWDLLKEMIRSEYRKPKHFNLVFEEKVLSKTKYTTGVIRFRLWQPRHNEEDQWAIDNLIIKPAVETHTLQADFAEASNVLSPWLSSSRFSQKDYCHSDDMAQVMDSTDPLRMAVTNRLTLSQGDVISFQISAGCKREAGHHFPVRLEFSRDGGNSWKLLNDGCLPSTLECKGPMEPTVYWPGRHGPWQRFNIPVDHRLAHGDVQLRWIQENPGETSGGEFALKKLYIGPLCNYSCMGHGTCTAAGHCKCDAGFSGKFCVKSESKNSRWLREGFDEEELSPDFWESSDGALVSAGCNPDHIGSVMFFSGSGHRFITTKELDVRNVRFLIFDLQIGANAFESRCQTGESPKDNVILEYSSDNTLSWHLLQEFEPTQTITRNHPFFIPLPTKARTKQTRFRWWQLPPRMLFLEEDEQAEWQLDNIMVMANETLPLNIVENFSLPLSDDWFTIKGGQPGQECHGNDKALVFQGHRPSRQAETWDFEVTEATVLQFDIMPGCEARKTATSVRVEYSTNNGKTWELVRGECVPPNSVCETHDLPSIYSSQAISNWTRVTLPLPQKILGERARLIFRQSRDKETFDHASTWAIDNIFIGDSCPWMCSGHGHCQRKQCICDEGYFGEFCVPAKVLPCEALDTFNKDEIQADVWRDVQGAEISNRCGTIVSKTALVFFKDGVRYATTVDLDMTGGQFVQFTLFMGCDGKNKKFRKRTILEEDHSYSEDSGVILVQYSTNGGIVWNDLKIIQFRLQNQASFVTIGLHDFPKARSNATQFRIWQPLLHHSFENVWALDNLFIGGQPVNPNVLYEDFNGPKPVKDAWIDLPAGFHRTMCDNYESRSSIVFGAEEGEHAAYTRDLSIDEHSVIQFDIRVGCANETIAEHNVTLEYSTDFGVTWEPVRLVQPLFSKSPDYRHELYTPSVYYPNAARGWKRVIIPLNQISACGNVRFRWWQGYYHSKETSEEWGLDNLYIGPSCRKHCTGHGYCINGEVCDCDDGHEDESVCHSSIQKDQEILEAFEDKSFSTNFIRWSGAEVSNLCGVLSGQSLLFWQHGERMLVTRDLDLSSGSVVQFYLRLACSDLMYGLSSDKEQPIILQSSSDGGISWNLIKTLTKTTNAMEDLPQTRHFTISLPDFSKTNSTRLRWWQPSVDGRFSSQWAIDQIYVGSTALGLPFFFDNGTGSAWLLRPGSKVEEACDFGLVGIHFSEVNGVRFAETPDIVTTRTTFFQFEISIGCRETNHCFKVFVEYSIDHGKSWHLVREECLPSDPDCPEFWPSSLVPSDVHTSLTMVTLSIPSRARSRLARFRFSQKAPWDSQHSWFVAKVYAGDECPQKCSGRGFCEAGSCNCHEGWTGDDCSKRLTKLPKFIADDFKQAPSSGMWKTVVGAKVSDICGPIASGSALHFYGGCSRLLETADIDLSEALFIQFDFKTGCLDPPSHSNGSGDNSVLVQISCNAGISWTTLRRMPLTYQEPKYVWVEIPKSSRCTSGSVRWWQPGSGPRPNRFDWALDSIVVGGKDEPPSSLSLVSPDDLTFPLWLRGYNSKPGMYCDFNDTVQVLESTPSEPAVVQTTDLQLTREHSLHFRLALGCGALWDNSIEPVSLQFSRDFGRTWSLVRELCLPFNSTSCTDLHDESVFYAPQHWQYYVFPLHNLAPSKYARFRWIQNETADVMGTHKWALRDVYIGLSCPHHCLGRGSCTGGECKCSVNYSGEHCQDIITGNAPYIKDTFKGHHFLDHWQHVQGALLAPGCGESLEEPPTATFQGYHTRAIMSKPLDMRSARFAMFTAQIGNTHGSDLCRQPTERVHNVFLQYSVDGGIKWHLLRELDHTIYKKPIEDYILIPRHAKTAATVFRFWQPRLFITPPAWSLDNVFIGGSEIGSSELVEVFDNEPTVSEWLFAPHSKTENNYCQRGDNGSLTWEADHPGHRAITTQELLVQDGHVLQFKISVGCQQIKIECYQGPQVQLQFRKEGTVGWDLVSDSCLPDTSPDPDCFPYTFHGPSSFPPDVYSSWTRVTVPLPEKTWSSTTQLRWVQDAGRGNGQMERILPWALDDVYVGAKCEKHCRGRGDCVQGKCVCDHGYEGPTCEPHPTHKGPLPSSLIDGFEGGISANWAVVTGGKIGLGCNSMAPYGHGKHLYFSGCGIRQAITYDLDTRRASKVMFVLRIGSHDDTRSCRVDLSDHKRTGNKGVILQYSSDNGVTWATIDVHSPLDFKKARRVAYSLPMDARQNGVQLRWWQPDHDGTGVDQWALDNVEIVLAQRKPTHQYDSHIYHQEDL